MTSRQAAPSSDSLFLASSFELSHESLTKAPRQSPTCVQEIVEEEPREHRPVATALHSHLLHQDVGRQVVIVCCSHKKRQHTLENGWNDEGLDDVPWF